MPNSLVLASHSHRRKARRAPVFSRLAFAWVGLSATLAGIGAGLATLGRDASHQRYAVNLDDVERLSPTTPSPAPSSGGELLQPPQLDSSPANAAAPAQTAATDETAAAAPILASAQRFLPSANGFSTGDAGQPAEGGPRIIRIPSSARFTNADDAIDNAANGEGVLITIDGAPARSREEMVADAERRLVATPDPIPAPAPDMLLSGAFGPLPRISKEGVAPSEAYAHAFTPGDTPHVALIVGGLGLNPALTARAIDELPSTVTLAFAPYAKDLPYWTERARESGHEILIELPMEQGGGDGDKAIGPAGLKTGRAPQDNLKRLEWLMSRFGGYVGATNYLGARLAGDSEAIRPILTRLDAAGVYFFDDTGAVHRFSAPTARGVASVSRLITPGSSNPKEDLSALEAVANRDGAALGKAYLTPESFDVVLAWSNTLDDRDLTLAPASGVFALASQADG